MEHDILTPEFIAFADSVKQLYQTKEEKTKAFKEIYLKHKAELDELDKAAVMLKKGFDEATKSKVVGESSEGKKRG